MTYAPINSESPYLPETTVLPIDIESLIPFLTTNYISTALRLNFKENALYFLDEQITGRQYFVSGDPQDTREGYRKVFEIGAIAAGATLTFAHGITGFSTLNFVDSYGEVITDAATFNKRHIPYTDAALITNQIQMDKDDTNIRIVNGATAPNILSGIVVVEYLKN